MLVNIRAIRANRHAMTARLATTARTRTCSRTHRKETVRLDTSALLAYSMKRFHVQLASTKQPRQTMALHVISAQQESSAPTLQQSHLKRAQRVSIALKKVQPLNAVLMAKSAQLPMQRPNKLLPNAELVTTVLRAKRPNAGLVITVLKVQ